MKNTIPRILLKQCLKSTESRDSTSIPSITCSWITKSTIPVGSKWTNVAQRSTKSIRSCPHLGICPTVLRIWLPSWNSISPSDKTNDYHEEFQSNLRMARAARPIKAGDWRRRDEESVRSWTILPLIDHNWDHSNSNSRSKSPQSVRPWNSESAKPKPTAKRPLWSLQITWNAKKKDPKAGDSAD